MQHHHWYRPPHTCTASQLQIPGVCDDKCIHQCSCPSCPIHNMYNPRSSVQISVEGYGPTADAIYVRRGIVGGGVLQAQRFTLSSTKTTVETQEPQCSDAHCPQHDLPAAILHHVVFQVCVHLFLIHTHSCTHSAYTPTQLDEAVSALHAPDHRHAPHGSQTLHQA